MVTVIFYNELIYTCYILHGTIDLMETCVTS